MVVIDQIRLRLTAHRSVGIWHLVVSAPFGGQCVPEEQEKNVRHAFGEKT